MSIYSRTDLALEEHELCLQKLHSTSAIQGVKVNTKLFHNLQISELQILNSHAAAALNKPAGNYYTIEFSRPFHPGSSDFNDACISISDCILNLLPRSSGSILVAALGNPDITPDSLGPIAASNLLVTHHLKKSHSEEFSAFGDCMLLRPGVLGTSGIESAQQIKAFCNCFHPKCVIAIDALAGLEYKRLCRCVQISDSGISPGSGVGNNREALNLDFLGVPVISVGVPTVIDASTFSDRSELRGSFVTPRDIDSSVRAASRIIAYGINLAIHPGLSIEDIDLLVG